MRILFAVVMQNESRTLFFVEGNTEDDVRRTIAAETSTNFDILGAVAVDQHDNKMFRVHKDLVEKLIG